MTETTRITCGVQLYICLACSLIIVEPRQGHIMYVHYLQVFIELAHKIYIQHNRKKIKFQEIMCSMHQEKKIVFNNQGTLP